MPGSCRRQYPSRMRSLEGLRRPSQYEGLCYSVRPQSDLDDEDGDARLVGLPRYGAAFLAFVEVRDMGYVVFDWEWRNEDPEEPGNPLGWKDDFADRAAPVYFPNRLPSRSFMEETGRASGAFERGRTASRPS